MRLIGRLLMVLLACMLAAMASFGVLVTLGFERVTQELHAGGANPDWWTELPNILQGLSILAQFGALVPALLLVIVGEVARIRSAIYYIVGGGLALAILPLLARASVGTDVLGGHAVWQVFATAGFAGGLVYWLLAGRRA